LFLRHTENEFPVFRPVDETDESDDAIVEIWDKDYGVLYQKKSLRPLRQHDDRNGSLWVIDKQFVMEPWVGGMVLGQLPGYDTKGARLVPLTQMEFDELMEQYRREHGYYPDT
jgi:hypothetical protein